VNVDPEKLEGFMGKMIGHMTGSTLCYSIWLGDELGLYRQERGLCRLGQRRAGGHDAGQVRRSFFYVTDLYFGGSCSVPQRRRSGFQGPGLSRVKSEQDERIQHLAQSGPRRSRQHDACVG